MYPHRIRLRGPWTYEPVARTVVHPDGHIEPVPGPLPAPGQLKIPTTWRGTVLDGFRGRVCWRRNFHAPRSLESSEKLWLVFAGVDYFADVSLNGVALGRHEGYFDPFEFEVTALVAERNELVVDVDCPAEADVAHRRLIRGSLETHDPGFVAGIWQTVALEVRAIAFLRDVAVQATLEGKAGRIVATGRVVGEPGNSVALDMSVDGTWFGRQKLQPTREGTPFTIESRIDGVELWWPASLGAHRLYSVQLELHGAARTLDSRSCRVGFRTIVVDPSLTEVELNGRQLPVIHVDVGAGNNPLELADPWPGSQSQRAAIGPEELLLARVAGRVITPGSYDWADENGILLSQDFPLAGDYSRHLNLRAEAVRQSAAMVRQLGHHPSIALWSSHLKTTAAHAALDAAVTSAIRQLDPIRPCLPCWPVGDSQAAEAKPRSQ